MNTSGLVGAIALAIITGTIVHAQATGIPAEIPPASFTGNQYVDSNGCAFIRAGISGNVTWVPRVTRAREQSCNFQPTFAQAPAPSVTQTPANTPEIAIASTPTPGVATQTQAASAAGTAPIETVASLTGPVVIEIPASARSRSTARRAAAPVAAAAPATPVVAPEPRRITRSQACAGLYGVQPRFISSSTGQPIDCGPAPVAEVAAVAEPRPREMTMAQICAEAATTNIRFINAMTGEPIVCAHVAVAANTMPCDGQIAFMSTVGDMPVRCGPQAMSPHGETQIASGGGLFSPTIPASNPVGVTAGRANPPAGYQQAWTDGRVNPQRGVQASAAARVSTLNTVPASVQASAAYRYVQVGSFGVPTNATRLGQRLGTMGLPVSMATRGSLKIVLAGPFTSPDQAQRALQAVRGLGFSDAFARN
jgi:hypothetical protein